MLVVGGRDMEIEMRIWTLFGLCAFLAACISVAGTGRLAGERSLSDTKHGYAVVDDVARAGFMSQRFEVRAGDCGASIGLRGVWSDCENDRERSEFSIDKRWTYGENIWIGFSVFLPEDFKTSSNVRTTVGQIHQRGGAAGTAGGFPSFPPLFQLEMKGDRYFLRVHMLSGDVNNVRNGVRDFNLTDVSKMRGQWTDITINFNTEGDIELLQVFVNGVRRAKIEDWIVFKPESYYFKYGIYRSFVSRNISPMPTQVLYIDEVRIGSDMASVLVNSDRPVD